MTASAASVEQLASAIERHVPLEEIRPLIDDLLKVEGNASLRATIAALDRRFPKKLGIIGRERSLLDRITGKLHTAAQREADYGPIRSTARGNRFELKLDGTHVVVVAVELDRVEQRAG